MVRALSRVEQQFLEHSLPSGRSRYIRHLDIVGPSWVLWPGSEVVHIVVDAEVSTTMCKKRFWMSDPFLLVNPEFGTPCPLCVRTAELELPSVISST